MTVADEHKKFNEDHPERTEAERVAYERTFFYGASSALACLLADTPPGTVDRAKLNYTALELAAAKRGEAWLRGQTDDPRRVDLTGEWQRGGIKKTEVNLATYYAGADAVLKLVRFPSPRTDFIETRVSELMVEVMAYFTPKPAGEFPFTTVAAAAEAFLSDSGADKLMPRVRGEVQATFYAGAQVAVTLVCDEITRPSEACVRAVAAELLAFTPDETGTRQRPRPQERTLAAELHKLTGDESERDSRGYAERERVFYTGARVALSLVTGKPGRALDADDLDLDWQRLRAVIDELGAYALDDLKKRQAGDTLH